MRWWRRRSRRYDELTRLSVLVAGDRALAAEVTAAAAAHPCCRPLPGVCSEAGLVSAILRRRPDYALLCGPEGDQPPDLVLRAVRTAAHPPTTRIVVFERIGTQVVHEPVSVLHDDELHLLDELAAPLCRQHIA